MTTHRPLFDASDWMDFDAFLDLTRRAASGQVSAAIYDDERLVSYTAANLHRMERMLRKVDLSKKLYNRLQEVEGPWTWYVFNEPWCGDASFALPWLRVMELASGGRIELRILQRDTHLDLMDRYLTNGGRSIAKLVCFAGEQELGTWGPRPDILQQLVRDCMDNGVSMDEKIKLVHSWYQKDAGDAMQREFIALTRQWTTDERPHAHDQ